MASMDKQSVRGEFDKIKSQFKELKANKKVWVYPTFGGTLKPVNYPHNTLTLSL